MWKYTQQFTARAGWYMHYCHQPGCEGLEGFPVLWHRATMTDPEWPDRDTCPHCGSEMFPEPAFWLDYDSVEEAIMDAIWERLDKWSGDEPIVFEVTCGQSDNGDEDWILPFFVSIDVPAWEAEDIYALCDAGIDSPVAQAEYMWEELLPQLEAHKRRHEKGAADE